MKTIQTIVAAALTIAFVAAVAVSASEPLLSPRAQSNQIPKVSGVTAGQASAMTGCGHPAATTAKSEAPAMACCQPKKATDSAKPSEVPSKAHAAHGTSKSCCN